MAANEARGEVDLVVGEQFYTLRLGINAICKAEALEGRTFGQIALAIENNSLRDIRLLFWAALQAYHGTIVDTTPGVPPGTLRARTVADVGDLIEELGTEAIVEKLVTLTARLFKLNEPPQALQPSGQGTAQDPPHAQVGSVGAGGTGSASSSTLVASA